tara:strand:+ start:940 stop:1227 length:288 start_codon:yes stop_codon:yes gene_type:complete
MITNFKKKDIIKELSFKTGYSMLFSKKLIDNLLECITANICSNELILNNFGVFKTILKKKRIGRNPKTNKEYTIHSRRSLKFTPSRNFKDYLNNE